MVKFSCFCGAVSEFRTYLTFWFNKSHYKIYRSLENKKKKMSLTNAVYESFCQTKSYLQTNYLKLWKVHKGFIFSCSHLEYFNSFKFKYFIVNGEYFHLGWYLDLLLWYMCVTKNKLTIPNKQKMVSRRVK